MGTPEANNGIKRAILAVGGQAALAQKLGVKQPAISYYLYKRCPAEKAILIEKITGVPRSEIRPDLFTKDKQKGGNRKNKK